jgi:hypothetical protein
MERLMPDTTGREAPAAGLAPAGPWVLKDKPEDDSGGDERSIPDRGEQAKAAGSNAIARPTDWAVALIRATLAFMQTGLEPDWRGVVER